MRLLRPGSVRVSGSQQESAAIRPVSRRDQRHRSGRACDAQGGSCRPGPGRRRLNCQARAAGRFPQARTQSGQTGCFLTRRPRGMRASATRRGNGRQTVVCVTRGQRSRGMPGRARAPALGPARRARAAFWRAPRPRRTRSSVGAAARPACPASWRARRPRARLVDHAPPSPTAPKFCVCNFPAGFEALFPFAPLSINRCLDFWRDLECSYGDRHYRRCDYRRGHSDRGRAADRQAYQG